MSAPVCPYCGINKIYFEARAYLTGGSVTPAWFDADVRVGLELLGASTVLKCDDGHDFPASMIQKIKGEERPKGVPFRSSGRMLIV